jgi:hypothetical protein
VSLKLNILILLLFKCVIKGLWKDAVQTSMEDMQVDSPLQECIDKCVFRYIKDKLTMQGRDAAIYRVNLVEVERPYFISKSPK